MTDTTKLSAEQIGFLTFEGGGANGLTTHPGAIRALTELGVLRYDQGLQNRIEGFAGTSSGSFIATLAASGYQADEISTLTGLDANNLSFNNEALRQGAFAAMGGRCISKGRLTKLASVTIESLCADPVGVTLGAVANIDNPLLLAVLLSKLSEILKSYPQLAYVAAKGLTVTGSPDHPFNLLKYDYGIFSGCSWRDYIDYCIAFARYRVDFIDTDTWVPIDIPTDDDFQDAKAVADPFIAAIQRAAEEVGDTAAYEAAEEDLEARRGTTFSEHHDFFFRHARTDTNFPSLVIGAANVATQESHLLSRIATPEMWVADAVRISTGLPFLFKPVFIESSDVTRVKAIQGTNRYGQDHFLIGAWVDGGVYYNSPFEVFDEFARADWGTLGLGVNLGKPIAFDGLYSYGFGIWGLAYESNITATRVQLANFLELSGGGFGYVPTLDQLSAESVAACQSDAELATYAHFK